MRWDSSRQRKAGMTPRKRNGGLKRLLQQELLDRVDRFLEGQPFAWSVVEFCSDPIEVFLGVDRETGALREMLP